MLSCTVITSYLSVSSTKPKAGAPAVSSVSQCPVQWLAKKMQLPDFTIQMYGDDEPKVTGNVWTRTATQGDLWKMH